MIPFDIFSFLIFFSCHNSDIFLRFMISFPFDFLYDAYKSIWKGVSRLSNLKFIHEDGSFLLKQPENISYLYFPLASAKGLKSAVAPNLGGDAKIDQETFLLEPVSAENLHNNRSVRNFWCVLDNSVIYSAAGASASQEAARFSAMQDESEVTAGLMWHTLTRTSQACLLTSTVTSFIPWDSNVEILYVTVTNQADFTRKLTAWGAIPIYGRSADNLRDHRNVTSMLHRIKASHNGVLVSPTMSFDEKGHRPNHCIYYVTGSDGQGNPPVSFYPTVEDFIGEGGSFTHPRAVYECHPGYPPGSSAAGKEAMGAFRFETISLAPGEKAEYILLLGVENEEKQIASISRQYDTKDKVIQAFSDTKAYWQNQVSVCFHTGDKNFDSWMKWVCFQPFLRRLFGCSFLPHHDYGRGGRGWRDLWQDCLSLLLMEPERVGQMITMNFGGVRVDGTNATIIGSSDGSFFADRNGISRVWMDHALWPLITTRLYIDQTGDVGILNQPVSYFKDAQIMRASAVDTDWSEKDGNQQRTEENEVYMGTVLEHLLLQHLTAFFDVGDHNICRLHDADWNDALDMASERGESVAFTCAYAGNLMTLAETIRLLEKNSSLPCADLMEELTILLDNDPSAFDDISKKQEILKAFTSRCRRQISGRRRSFSLASLAVNLIQKANWLMEYLRSHEWIEGNEEEGWFNSYYDNHGRAVEGFRADHVRMMLTGQVFAIMSGVAEDSQIRKVVRSADHYLYQKDIGGYRLNTDFHELKFDMGRMFGFAYGEKENGAVFSHMTVMYANALYRRGFVKEGWKALKTLADTALDFDTSHIYPGIPEYFRSDGRGMYQYLTGAASWYMMTMITEVFGIHGNAGDLVLYPKLLTEQFDSEKSASVTVPFAGKLLTILYKNPYGKSFGSYIIGSAVLDGTALTVNEDAFVLISRKALTGLPQKAHSLVITLV